MVEFALVLPLLAVLLLGIVQFGIAFNNYLTLTDAVRAGARQAAVSRYLSDPEGAVDAKLRAAGSGLQNATDTSRLVVSITGVDSTTPPTWDPGSDVKVKATYPYDISLLGLVVASGRLSSATVERVE